MTEYLLNPLYMSPKTIDTISARMRVPVPFRPIPMGYYTREMVIMTIRKPNHARPITYGDAPWTLFGTMPAKGMSE